MWSAQRPSRRRAQPKAEGSASIAAAVEEPHRLGQHREDAEVAALVRISVHVLRQVEPRQHDGLGVAVLADATGAVAGAQTRFLPAPHRGLECRVSDEALVDMDLPSLHTPGDLLALLHVLG